MYYFHIFESGRALYIQKTCVIIITFGLVNNQKTNNANMRLTETWSVTTKYMEV